MELLIVVAIIAVAVAIMLPGLIRVRRRVVEVSCLSNLKQLGTAAMNYSQDFRQFMPTNTFVFSINGGDDEVSFMNYFYNNGINSKDVFLCPVLYSSEAWEPEKYNANNPYGKRNLPAGSYIMNTVHTWDGALSPVNSFYNAYYPYGFDRISTTVVASRPKALNWSARGWLDPPPSTTSSPSTDSKFPVKLTKVRHPSQVVYILDAIRKPKEYTGTPASWKSDMETLRSWRETDYGLFPTTSGIDRRDVGNHHLGGTFNVLFGDMRAERCVRSEPSSWIVHKALD